MATTYGVLGQVNPSAATLTTLYTVPTGKQTVISTLTVTNLSGSELTYRIAIRPAGAAIDRKHYVAYDSKIPGNDGIGITYGLTLAAGDVVSVYASTGDISFGLFGGEIL